MQCQVLLCCKICPATILPSPVDNGGEHKASQSRFLNPVVGLLSDIGSFLVVRSLHGKELLQFPLQGLKCGPLHLFLPPTLQHDVVQGFGTIWGAGHSVAVLHLMKNFSIGHTWNNSNVTLYCYYKRFMGIDAHLEKCFLAMKKKASSHTPHSNTAWKSCT